ncbi:MAG: hypothetical protein MUC85_00410 [Anaerolineales bacterium]|nr:hypothetical protein [Anaerolineales bacterium]
MNKPARQAFLHPFSRLSQGPKALGSPPPAPRPKAGEDNNSGCLRVALPPVNTPNPE